MSSVVDLTNPCSTVNNNYYVVPNSCAPDPSNDRDAYETIARQTCPLLSSEWRYNRGLTSRVAQDVNIECNLDPSLGLRANTTETGTIGKAVVCERTEFKGDPLTCSLQNYALSGQCFTNEQETCAPELLSQHAPAAQEQILDYCTGADLAVGDTSWTQRWAEGGGCFEALEFNLFHIPETPLLSAPVNIRQPNQLMSPAFFTNAEGFEFSRTLMNKVYDRYTQDGLQVGRYPGQNGFNPFQNDIYSICQNVPGICQSLLDKTCAAVTSDQLAVEPYLTPYCGCYMPDLEYRQYVNQWSINPECTPFCNLPVTIPLVEPSGTQQKFCQQDVCVIDDFTIDLINSDAQAININQICGSCTSANCTCLVNGLSLNFYDSRVQGSISLSQDCQSSQCSILDPKTNQYIDVPCDSSSSSSSVLEQIQEEEQHAQNVLRWKTLIIWAIVFLIVFGLVLIMWWLTRNEGSTTANNKATTT